MNITVTQAMQHTLMLTPTMMSSILIDSSSSKKTSFSIFFLF